MTFPKNLQTVRQAKDQCLSEFGSQAWFGGVGVAKESEGFVLRINVAPGQALPQDIQKGEYMGVPLRIVKIRGYTTRD